MNATVKKPNFLIIFGVPLLIILASILLVLSPAFTEYSNQLAIGITLDLLITLPLVYFLLIRKTKIVKTTVVPVLVLGMVICSIFIPEEHQSTLNIFKTWALPLIEFAVVFYIIYKVRNAIKHFKKHNDNSKDFFETLKETCTEIMPRILVTPFATEIAVFYYGFFSWKKRKLKANEFSYHKDSGTIALLIALMLIIVVETTGLHIWISKWSPVVAWILTILSVYTLLQVFGFTKSMFMRPINIQHGKLHLRYGIMSETKIAIENIESIVQSTKTIEDTEDALKLSLLGELESHNVIITLKNEAQLTRLYGIKKPYKVLALHVDDKNAFVQHVQDALTE